MNDAVKATTKPTVLLEMRPAFDGYAGIPQEVRLLFRGLRMLKRYDVAGMMQLSHRVLAKGTVEKNKLFNLMFMKGGQRIHRYSRVVISASRANVADVDVLASGITLLRRAF